MSVTGRHSWGRVSSLSPLQVTRAGAESGVDVWATAGMPLAVGDRVLLLDMDGALIVLQPLVPASAHAPDPGVDPVAPLHMSWLPEIDQAYMTQVWDADGDVDQEGWAHSGWWSDAEPGYAYFYLDYRSGVFYGCGPVAPYNSVQVMYTTGYDCEFVSPYPPGEGVPISAGAPYSASVHMLSTPKSPAGTKDFAPRCRVGIVWQDAAGAEISTSWGDTLTPTPHAYPWQWGSTGEAATYSFDAAHPTVTATAPSGAITARPVSGYTWDRTQRVGVVYMVSAFTLDSVV